MQLIKYLILSILCAVVLPATPAYAVIAPDQNFSATALRPAESQSQWAQSKFKRVKNTRKSRAQSNNKAIALSLGIPCLAITGLCIWQILSYKGIFSALISIFTGTVGAVCLLATIGCVILFFQKDAKKKK